MLSCHGWSWILIFNWIFHSGTTALPHTRTKVNIGQGNYSFPHNFVPSAAGTVAALAPFGFVEPRIGQPSFVQPSSSNTASVQSPSPSPSPPESIEEEPARPKTGRGYGKWSEQEEMLLVQLRYDKHMWLETRHSRQLWEEIAKEISKTGNVTSAQCQRKSKYLEDRYKEAKIIIITRQEATEKPHHSTTK